MSESDLLTVPETADLLRVKISTIRSWVCQRKIPYVKLGRLVRIRRRDAEALVESSIVKATCTNLGLASPARESETHAGTS
jgi:excisionase family DNA binding protein